MHNGTGVYYHNPLCVPFHFMYSVRCNNISQKSKHKIIVCGVVITLHTGYKVLHGLNLLKNEIPFEFVFVCFEYYMSVQNV